MLNTNLSRMGKPVLSSLTLTLLLSGCMLTSEYQQPELPVASNWSLATPATAATASAIPQWQSFVTDQTLRDLISLALNNNRDLRQTLLNVEAARAQYGVQRADRLPEFQLQSHTARQRVPDDLRSPEVPAVQSNYQAGIGLAAFELDVFGRIKSLTEAALQQYLSTEAAAQSAQISLIAEVIQTYLTYNGAQKRYALASHTRQTREASLELVKQQQKRGALSALDYQEALGLLQEAKIAQEHIKREQHAASNALTLLLGVPEIQPYLPATDAEDLVLLQELAAGAPSALLRRRPDIIAAEHTLRGRHASIDAARAAFFPRISLTGLLGVSSTELSDLVNSDQRSWSFTPQLSLPIFDAGRNQANLDLAQIRKDIAVANYEQTIQLAFREVADALSDTDTLRQEEAAQLTLAQSSAARLRLSQARYQHGADDYLRYLEAQRDDFSYQMTLIQVATQRQIALTSLFRALGGGWLADTTFAQADLQATAIATP